MVVEIHIQVIMSLHPEFISVKVEYERIWLHHIVLGGHLDIHVLYYVALLILRHQPFCPWSCMCRGL